MASTEYNPLMERLDDCRDYIRVAALAALSPDMGADGFAVHTVLKAAEKELAELSALVDQALFDAREASNG